MTASSSSTPLRRSIATMRAFLFATGGTREHREAPRQHAAVDEALELVLHECGQRRCEALLRRGVERAQVVPLLGLPRVVANDLMKRGRLGPAACVRRRARHPPRIRNRRACEWPARSRRFRCALGWRRALSPVAIATSPPWPASQLTQRARQLGPARRKPSRAECPRPRGSGLAPASPPCACWLRSVRTSSRET